MLHKIQEIKEEPDDSGQSAVKVESGKKKGGKTNQTVIEIEKGSTKLLVKMSFNKSSSLSMRMVRGNKCLMLQVVIQVMNLPKRRPKGKQVQVLNLLHLKQKENRIVK